MRKINLFCNSPMMHGDLDRRLQLYDQLIQEVKINHMFAALKEMNVHFTNTYAKLEAK